MQCTVLKSFVVLKYCSRGRECLKWGENEKDCRLITVAFLSCYYFVGSYFCSVIWIIVIFLRSDFCGTCAIFDRVLRGILILIYTYLRQRWSS